MNTDIILKEGDTGPEVTYIQQMLRITNYYPISITGVYGPDTTGFVLNFQKDNNLVEDGMIDNDDIVVLNKLTEPDKINFNVLSKPTIRQGDSGIYVTELQTKLKELGYYSGIISGNFDLTTYEAVKAYQFVNKLSPDGIVGTNTWSSLETLYQPLAVCGEEDIPGVDDITYTVVSGDTLYGISRKFGVSVDEIKSLNNLTSDSLSIGQILIIKKGTDDDSTTVDTIYTVVSGDTLYSISRKFGVSVDELKQLNNLNSDILTIGQKLIIKKGTDDDNEDGINYIDYIVKAGDTLYSIARQYEISVNELKDINNLISDILTINQVIKVPSNNITPETNITYIVKAGDTLYSIARQYQISVADLMDKNNLTTTILSIGQILKI